MSHPNDRELALDMAVKARDPHEDIYTTVRRADQFRMFLTPEPVGDKPNLADEIPF